MRLIIWDYKFPIICLSAFDINCHQGNRRGASLLPRDAWWESGRKYLQGNTRAYFNIILRTVTPAHREFAMCQTLFCGQCIFFNLILTTSWWGRSYGQPQLPDEKSRSLVAIVCRVESPTWAVWLETARPFNHCEVRTLIFPFRKSLNFVFMGRNVWRLLSL